MFTIPTGDMARGEKVQAVAQLRLDQRLNLLMIQKVAADVAVLVQ
jgi:hypothetical protein